MNCVFMGSHGSYWMSNSESSMEQATIFLTSSGFLKNLLDGVVRLDYHLMTREVRLESLGQGNEC